MNSTITTIEDFPGGPVVENPPSNTGDVGSIPGLGPKIPHAVGQLGPRTTIREAHELQPLRPCTAHIEPTCSTACASQQEKPMHHSEDPASQNKQDNHNHWSNDTFYFIFFYS